MTFKLKHLFIGLCSLVLLIPSFGFAAGDLVSAITVATTLTSDGTSIVGWTFEANANNTVAKLCSYQVDAGDTADNEIHLQDSTGATDLATTTVNMTGLSVGQQICGDITPVNLISGTTYTLVEVVGNGNHWKSADDGSLTFDTAIGSYVNSGYEAPLYTLITNGKPHGYGTPNLQIGSTPTSTPTSTDFTAYGLWGTITTSTQAMIVSTVPFWEIALGLCLAFFLLFFLAVGLSKTIRRLLR